MTPSWRILAATLRPRAIESMAPAHKTTVIVSNWIFNILPTAQGHLRTTHNTRDTPQNRIYYVLIVLRSWHSRRFSRKRSKTRQRRVQFTFHSNWLLFCPEQVVVLVNKVLNRLLFLSIRLFHAAKRCMCGCKSFSISDRRSNADLAPPPPPPPPLLQDY